MVEPSVPTALFPQNQSHGLMICGVNFGRDKNDERLDAAGIDRSDPFKSFFSDKRINDYRFRNNIVKWFRLWGFALEQEEGRAGDLERSIVQTNWLASAANNVKELNVERECIQQAEPFLSLCERLQPRLLLLFSADPLRALASAELRQRAEQVFGPIQGEIEWVEKEAPDVKAFKVGRLKFDKATVLSLPHATGTWGLSDQFIAAQDVVKAEVGNWWSKHQAYLKREATR